MRTLTQPELAWELHKAGVKVPIIAQRVGKHRATVYRWLSHGMLSGKGIRLRAYGGSFRSTRALRRPRRRKVNPYIERRVLSIRRKYQVWGGRRSSTG